MATYDFESRLVVDADRNIGRNAIGHVYPPGTTDYSEANALPVTDLNGLPMATITATNDGITPQFRTTDQPVVIWASGPYRLTMTSGQALASSAVTARTAAEAASALASTSAQAAQTAAQAAVDAATNAAGLPSGAPGQFVGYGLDGKPTPVAAPTITVGAGTVGPAELAATAVTSDKIASAAVTADKIASASVGKSKVAAVTGADALDLDVIRDSTTRLAVTPAQVSKLTGVETGATNNGPTASLLDRGNHTGNLPPQIVERYGSITPNTSGIVTVDLGQTVAGRVRVTATRNIVGWSWLNPPRTNDIVTGWSVNVRINPNGYTVVLPDPVPVDATATPLAVSWLGEEKPTIPVTGTFELSLVAEPDMVSGVLTGPFGIPPILYVGDNFDRADGQLAGSFSSSGGKVWTTVEQAGGALAPADVVIVGNAAGAKSGGVAASRLSYVDVGAADYTLEWDLTAVGSTAATAGGGPAFRAESNGKCFQLATRVNASTQGFSLYKQNADGTGNQLKTNSTLIPTTGDVLRVTMSGTNGEAFVVRGGVATSLFTWSDAASYTSTLAGMLVTASGAATRFGAFRRVA